MFEKVNYKFQPSLINEAKILGIKRNEIDRINSNYKQQLFSQSHSLDNDTGPSEDEGARNLQFDSEIIDAAEKITYITNHIKNENDYEEVNFI